MGEKVHLHSSRIAAEDKVPLFSFPAFFDIFRSHETSRRNLTGGHSVNIIRARVVKLADTPDLGSGAAKA